jgi:hypothetical protein
MGLSTLQRRIGAWLALLALLLGAFAPAATQAVVAGSDRAGWVQICSVSGMAWVQLDAGDDGSSPDNSAANGCTWCTGHAPGGLPPAANPWSLTGGATACVVQASPSAVLARTWPPAQSRAPPLL